MTKAIPSRKAGDPVAANLVRGVVPAPRQRVLITGSSGFVGQHLAGLLGEHGYSVHCLDRIAPQGLPEGCQPLVADLGDAASLGDLAPEWFGVIHLAGASIPSLFKTNAPVIANLQLTLNLLEHLQAARVLLVSSCHVYAPSGQLRHEDGPIAPQGGYGLSKHLLEQLAPHFQDRLDIRIARPFNHLGPGLRPELMVPSLLRRLAADPGEVAAPVVMQGQNNVRDFIDVRDVVSAYLAILEMEAPVHRTFNVCTGRPTSVADVVETVLDLKGSHRPIQFQDQPMSRDDIPFLVGDPSRLMDHSGWSPRFSLRDSLATMLESEAG